MVIKMSTEVVTLIVVTVAMPMLVMILKPDDLGGSSRNRPGPRHRRRTVTATVLAREPLSSSSR